MPETGEALRDALAMDPAIDITTTGRKSGQPCRMEIWYRNVEGRVFITGRPGARSWLANMRARPEFTFHLKESVQAGLPAKARVITDEAERRQVLTRPLDDPLGREFERWVAGSPLVEVESL